MEAVEVCWKQKVDKIRENERDAARRAYDMAKEAYQQIEEVSAVE